MTEEKKKKPQPKTSWQWIQRILLILVWLALLAYVIIHRQDLTVAEILKYTPADPLLAAILLWLLFALQSLTVVVYCGILYTASGILFPLPWAMLVNLIGTAIMVSLPYFIARKKGAATAQYVIERYPKAAHLREFQAQNDFVMTLFLRLVGVLPCDVVSLYLGAIGVAYKDYFFGCMLGMLPPVIIMPIIGMSVKDPHSPAFIGSCIAQLTVMITSMVLYYLYQRRQKKKLQDAVKE